MKTTLVVPDVQWPYHDGLVLKKLIKVAEDLQPNQIVQVGDGIDFPQVSRWTKGSAGEYAPTLQEHITGYVEGFLRPMAQAAPKAKRMWLRGNHDERLEDYISKYAPPVRTLDVLSTESLFSLDELGWTYEQGLTRIAPNTYMLHGHECGGYSATLSAWDTKFAKRYGSDENYVFGHTHQPGITTRGYGFNGKIKDRWTMNVGSIMDPVQASYVKDGSVSWVQSFAVIRDDGKRVYPELILMDDRGFVFEGKKY